jgi:hypothetical protein
LFHSIKREVEKVFPTNASLEEFLVTLKGILANEISLNQINDRSVFVSISSGNVISGSVHPFDRSTQPGSVPLGAPSGTGHLP